MKFVRPLYRALLQASVSHPEHVALFYSAAVRACACLPAHDFRRPHIVRALLVQVVNETEEYLRPANKLNVTPIHMNIVRLVCCCYVNCCAD